MAALVAYQVSTSGSSSSDSSGSDAGTPRPADEQSGCDQPVSQAALLPPALPVADLDAPGSGTTLGKRKRAFEHIEGNWATTILIPVPVAPHQAEVLKKLKTCILNCGLPAAEYCCAPDQVLASDGRVPPDTGGSSHGSASNVVPSELHISLSRTQPIQLPQKKALLAALKKSAASWKRCTLHFNGYQVFVNDERTRTFLALSLRGGRDAVVAMIRSVDAVLPRFRAASFYADPQPHVSLLSWPGDERARLEPHLPRLQELCGEIIGGGVPVSEVICAVGHERHKIWKA